MSRFFLMPEPKSSKEIYFLLIEFIQKICFLEVGFMKRFKRFWLCATAALAIGIAGCNLFNPTENADIDDDDVDALTYEAYIHFRNAEYTIAREYFEKVLKADSTVSEAWYGLAKCVLNQQGLNVFEMLKYANAKDGQSAFLEMDDSTANHYKTAITAVLEVLDPFIERDSTGRTDGKVTFKTISASYTVLHLTKAAIMVRNNINDITGLFSFSDGAMDIDWSSLKGMGESSVEMFESMGDIGHAIKADPSIATEVLKSYVPEAALLSDSGLTVATEAMATYMITASEAVTSNEDAIIAYTSIGDMMDGDGDGCIDEEIADNFDNDGDGLVDEDMRQNQAMVPETNFLQHRFGQIASVKTAEGYETVDIDMNGKAADEGEFTFAIEGSNDRDAQNNHLFKAFAANFGFAESGNTLAENMNLAKKDRDVNNIKYDLAWRKANIGGCWANYDEEMFLKWIEGRD